MKYLIVSLIKGDAEEYQQKLLYSVAKQFGVSGAIQRKPPAHITLKYSFEIENILPVEKCIEEFCKLNKKSKFKIKGIGYFGKDVIFLDVVPSNEMKEIYMCFIELLKKKTKIEFKQFDGNTHFHSSIAHTDITEKFDKILAFLCNERPDFDVFFDNIYLF